MASTIAGASAGEKSFSETVWCTWTAFTAPWSGASRGGHPVSAPHSVRLTTSGWAAWAGWARRAAAPAPRAASPRLTKCSRSPLTGRLSRYCMPFAVPTQGGSEARAIRSPRRGSGLWSSCASSSCQRLQPRPGRRTRTSISGSARPRQRMPSRWNRCLVSSRGESAPPSAARASALGRGTSSKSKGFAATDVAGRARRTQRSAAAEAGSFTGNGNTPADPRLRNCKIRCSSPLPMRSGQSGEPSAERCDPRALGRAESLAALRGRLGPVRAVLVAEGADRVHDVLVPARAGERLAGAARVRVAVPGGRSDRGPHVAPGHHDHLVVVLIEQRANGLAPLLGDARLDPEDHPAVLQGVHQLLVGRRLVVEAVLRRDLVVAPVRGRVVVVVDVLVERCRVILHAAAALAAQVAARRLGRRLELELRLLGYVAALGEDVTAALALGAVAARGQEHDRRDRGDGEQPAAAVANELLAALGLPRLRLAPLAFAAQGLLLTLASGHSRGSLATRMRVAAGTRGRPPPRSAARPRGGRLPPQHDQLVRQPLGREAELEDRRGLHEPGFR